MGILGITKTLSFNIVWIRTTKNNILFQSVIPQLSNNSRCRKLVIAVHNSTERFNNSKSFFELKIVLSTDTR